MLRAGGTAMEIAASVSAQLDALGAQPSRALPLQVDRGDIRTQYPAMVALIVAPPARPPARWRRWAARHIPLLPEPAPRPGLPVDRRTMELHYTDHTLIEAFATLQYVTCAQQQQQLDPGPLRDKATEVLGTLRRALWGVGEISQGARQLHQTAQDLQFINAEPALAANLLQVEKQATDYVKRTTQRFQQVATMFQQLNKAQQLLNNPRAEVVAATQIRLGDLERAVDSLLQDAETALISLVGPTDLSVAALP
jgi:hypothetical protein